MTEYRYKLTRKLSPLVNDGTTILWCMLNPSTATEEEDDPTIRRCMQFSNREGVERMVVVNLFAARATHPRDLWKREGIIGPDNDLTIVQEAKEADKIICAWGALSNDFFRNRAQFVLGMLHGASGKETYCLGKTVEGFPRHPLYLNRMMPLIKFP